MAKTESKRIVRWIRHPVHGLAIVQAPSWEQATVEAARWWDVPWGRVAALCEAKARDMAASRKAAGKRFWREMGPRSFAPPAKDGESEGYEHMGMCRGSWAQTAAIAGGRLSRA